MKVKIERCGYPRTVDEGLEKNKYWYEYQLLEVTEKEITDSEYVEIISNAADIGWYIEQVDDFTQVLDVPDITYTFTFEK